MNRQDLHWSEEMLNALVDGEFDTAERAELLESLQRDSADAQAVCELRALKDMVKLAYHDIPEAPTRARAPRQYPAWAAVAAGLVLGITGLLVGWQMQPATEAERFVLADPAQRDTGPLTVPTEDARIVFHVTDPAAEVATELLDEVESVLAHYQSQHQPLRVEVVAHGEGLGLLRQRLSSHQARVAKLADSYPNLTFVACENTIQRLKTEQGVEVVLLPEASVTASGVAHVVKRQREGWSYVQV